MEGKMESLIPVNKSWNIVTGANAGIGKAVVEGLAAKGLSVIMLCRSRDKAEAALGDIKSRVPYADIKIVIGDLSDNAGVRLAAQNLLAEAPKIAALINNAGIWMTECELNADGIEKSFYVNCLAPFLLTNLLIERLKESAPARIVNVNAGLYVFGKIDFERTPYGKDFSMFRSYCNSKLAGVMTTLELAKRLEGSGVTINALHPGVIKSNLGGTKDLKGKLINLIKLLFKTPEKGAEPVIYLAASGEVKGISGHFFLLKKEIPIIAKAKDEALGKQIWNLSEKLTGLNKAL
jgi:NAD(P)-dependent dehydrogenase (short-subunit alcohol dehydrogenase family)